MRLTEDFPFTVLRRTWQPVSNSRQLERGQVIAYTLLGVELVLARFSDGQVLAADVACPHKGARLSQGSVRDGELMCPYHGWRFDAQGTCQSIPSLRQPSPEKQALAHLHAYATQERYGLVWVKLESGPLPNGRTHELPDVPEFENARWSCLPGPPPPFAAGWRREVENYVDMTHFAFAHADTLGKSADHRVPEMAITLRDDGGFEMNAAFPALATPHEPPGKLQSAHARFQRCSLPNFTIIRQSFPDGDQRVLLHVPSPNTRESCTVFWILAISPGFRGPAPADQLAFAVRVLEEDCRMCESQVPAEVPINPARGGWGVLVMPGDSLANTFQKCLRRWLLAGEDDPSGETRKV